MSAKTPRVVHSVLSEPFSGREIVLDTPEWYAWLADDAHRSFHYDASDGGFTARKERKQRGQWYWVAYRQCHNKLYKLYLGKAETLSSTHLLTATQELARHAAEEQTVEP